MNTSIENDEQEFIERVRGLFLGLLDSAEATRVYDLVRAGKLRLSYEGAAGMMGLARVREANADSRP